MWRACLALLCTSCVFEWDRSAPSITLSGAPPSVASFDHLNSMPAGLAMPMKGVDGSPWVAFCEFSSRGGEGGGFGGRGCKRMHLVNLGANPTVPEEIFTADQFTTFGKELYIMHDDTQAMTRTLTMHRPGDPSSSDVTVSVPTGRAFISANDDHHGNGDADVFLYAVLERSTTTFDVFRRDGKHQRNLPLPSGLDPTGFDDQLAFDEFTTDGSTLVLQTADGQTVAFGTLDDSTVMLGTRPINLLLDSPRSALLTVGNDGFRSVPLNGSSEHLFSPDGFDATSLLVDKDLAYFPDGGSLWSIPLDGSAAPKMVQVNAARALLVGPNGEVVYSHDPGDRYVFGAGDGWLGSWNFMNRGQLLTWSHVGNRLYFLENAAMLDTVGNLMAATVPGGVPQPLGINVHDYAELPDGRILSLENHVFEGTWNRLVVIDETAGTKKWVSPATAEFLYVPDANVIIADVVVSADGYDILRIPVPEQ
jgi:hypothetical protein